MIALINLYCWENISKATKLPNSLVPVVWSTTQGSLFVMLPDILNCLMNHSTSGKRLSCNFLHLMDINILQSWSVCFQTGLKPSLAILLKKKKKKHYSYLGNSSILYCGRKTHFIDRVHVCTDYLTSSGFTTLLLCFLPSFLWFS